MEFKYSDQFMSSLCMSTRNEIQFYPEYTRSQEDLQFVEVKIHCEHMVHKVLTLVAHTFKYHR